MEAAKKSVTVQLRACLVSVKGRMQLQQLERDYRVMMGESIPYSKFGFKNLEQFLRSEPAFTVSNINGEIFVDARISDKSAHIAEMVHKQKSTKKKPVKKAKFNYNSNWTPPPTSTRRNFYSTPQKPSVASKVVVPNRFTGGGNSWGGGSKKKSSTKTTTTTNLNTRLQMKNNDTHHHNSTSNHTSYNNTTNNTSSYKNTISAPSTNQYSNDKPMVKVEVQTYKSNVETVVDNKWKVPTLNNTSGTGSTTNTTTATGSSVRRPPMKLPTKQNGVHGAHSATANVMVEAQGENSSELTSTRKRLSARMREIEQERAMQQVFRSPVPSMYSPTTVPTQNTIEFGNFMYPNTGRTLNKEFKLTGDPVKDLESFVAHHHLGEIKENIVKIRAFKEHACTLTIGKHKFITFPKVFETAKLAKQHCAAEALENLMSIYNTSLLVSNPKDVLERIPPMLEQHANALWDWQVENNYTEKYKEKLPVDWLKIVDTSPTVSIDKATTGCILSHCDRLSKGLKKHTGLHVEAVSVRSNTLFLGADNDMFAMVTYIVKVDEIWCRQTQTNESNLFDEMQPKMQQFYDNAINRKPAQYISKDCYYVIRNEDIWSRVRVVIVHETDVMCFLIDSGNTVTKAKTDVYLMSPEFATAQSQAFVCRLAGLEELYEESESFKSLEILENKEVILHLISEYDKSNPCLPVKIYDLNMGYCYNEELESMLSIESASLEIEKNKIVEVYASNIEKNGDIYIQYPSYGYYSMLKRMYDLESFIQTEPPTELLKTVTKDMEDKMYFAQFKNDGHWYRIRIIDWSPNGDLAQIYYVDYGNTDVITVKEELLYPLDELDSELAEYPPQALRVRMAIDTIPNNFVELATKLMPDDQPVLLKIVDYGDDDMPLGEFFKRHTDGGLFCINKSIAMDAELKKDDTNNNSKHSAKNWINTKKVPSGGRLPSPKLPEKGSQFEVCVSFAVSPYNFFVQPLSSHSQLHKMMRNLQERYNDIQCSPLPVDSIVPGMIYASKFDDNNWYRTTVLKVINETSISVFYCDYGYYTNLTVYQLVPLDPEFLELPFQALKAKIPDIKPVQSKWTMEDCEFFKNLVEKKFFFSILMDIEKDELYQEDMVLNLIMVDTSSEEDDIFISKELIRHKNAIEA